MPKTNKQKKNKTGDQKIYSSTSFLKVVISNKRDAFGTNHFTP